MVEKDMIESLLPLGGRPRNCNHRWAKNSSQTKVVELVEGYEVRLRSICDTWPRWPAKRKILSESRRYESQKVQCEALGVFGRPSRVSNEVGYLPGSI